MAYVEPTPQQTIGREKFGLIIVIMGFITLVAMALVLYLFVEDLGILIIVFLIPCALTIPFGILTMKGVIFKQLKTNAEVAAERNKRY